ncbi:type I secretion C-terminal target domain-containing protein [uncultured Endozoicomonas sp.]|uniref:type I secretion C-terminal target domain-containing protein n=1 Tax=uncultured Endozoicomonas sp. TaxID=432652 RepID=UPI0026186D04|nr:type I secretion C-terminal target domain-containing protein [uncultured Endozoicomonas sp.]
MDENTGEIVGYISEAEGMVLIANEEGEIRTASVGDPLYMNDTVVNQSDTNIVIELINNQLLYLNSSQQVFLNPIFFSASTELTINNSEPLVDQEATNTTIEIQEPTGESGNQQPQKETDNPNENQPLADAHLEEVIIDYEEESINNADTDNTLKAESYIPENTMTDGYSTQAAEPQVATGTEITYSSSGHNDTLIGDSDDDIFFVSHDNTTITGDGGADTFIFSADGTSDNPAELIINDFSTTEGDVLQLEDIMIDESNNLDDYFHFERSGDDTIMEIRSDAGGDVTKTVTLKDTNLFSLGGNDSEIINSLLDNGNLTHD